MRAVWGFGIFLNVLLGEVFYPYEEKSSNFIENKQEIKQILFERESAFKKDTFLREKRIYIIEQSKYNEYKNLKNNLK